jgi:hypothetical protein
MTAGNSVLNFVRTGGELSDGEYRDLIDVLERDRAQAEFLVEQFLMDDLISRALSQERSNFTNGVLQGIADAEKGGLAEVTVQDIEDRISEIELYTGRKIVSPGFAVRVAAQGVKGIQGIADSILHTGQLIFAGLRRRGSWLFASFVFHAACFLVAAVLFVAGPEKPEEPAFVEMDIKPIQGEGITRTFKMGFRQRKLELTEGVPFIEKPDILNGNVFDLEIPEDIEKMHKSRCLEESLSIIDLSGEAWFDEIGKTSDVSVSFINRKNLNRRAAVERFGGSPATESAVLDALRWLSRHQEEDGHWNTRKWGAQGSSGVGWGKAYFDESVTGLAVLAYLGAGHTHRTGRFRKNVRKAIEWIISKQRIDGSYSDGKAQEYEEYDAAICTLALAEAYGMTHDPITREAAQRGVNYILKQQKPSGGWVHGPYDSTSVLGWMVMALKSAKFAGLDVPKKAFTNALKRLNDVSDTDAKGFPGLVGYVEKGKHLFHQGLTMTAVGMLSYQFLGKGSKTEKQADILIKHAPRWRPDLVGARTVPQNFYHWYYGTLAMHQFGKGYWEKWNRALKDTLLPNQRKGGLKDGSMNDVDGSWDPVTRYDNVGGRVYSTAMGALCFEVYYRYSLLSTVIRNK